MNDERQRAPRRADGAAGPGGGRSAGPDLAISARDLVRAFEDGRVRALDGVSFDVERGETLAVMGPSGSGKTTLLNLLGALDRPTSGRLAIAGEEVVLGGHDQDLDRLRAREIGFIFQLHNLIPTLSARENVELPMMGLRVPRAARRRRSEELLGRVGLADRADFSVKKLSGGERQRVAVARALANRPHLLLGDEPTGSLDSRTGTEVIDLLLELRREHGLTIVLVTHDPGVASRMARIVELRDGRVSGDRRV
ncbi:MAG TPA: ABC transporter ATP-binding protein [Thermoanaerobaculia bacterium]|nr:ABC transporter ATP-binding protein [Thermoanaerobaculia bacterium]